MDKSTKSIVLWGSVIVGIVAIVFLLAKFGDGTATTGTSSTSLKTPISENDHTKGSENPKVTIVEYSDFQCPACAATYPLIKQLVQTFEDDVQFVYRHFPLSTIHQHAELSAKASEAAAAQGKFWEMHDILFNTQAEWSVLPDPTEFFVTLASSIGLDETQFRSDLANEEIKKRVDLSAGDASAMRLPGTPSFFVNGSIITNPSSYIAFKALIEAELAK